MLLSCRLDEYFIDGGAYTSVGASMFVAGFRRAPDALAAIWVGVTRAAGAGLCHASR